MAFVPGFEYDVFVSYAHGDNREWIGRFAGQLESVLKHKLGDPAKVWIDKEELRATRDFRKEIPDTVAGSAIFLFLPSPTYIRSQYCVEIECPTFQETLAARRERFSGREFANELYALRCPIEHIDDNEHWNLFPGLTDIPFFGKSDTYPVAGPDFEAAFSELAQKLVPLLKRMRNHSTPVFLYPPNPGPDLLEARRSLADELADRSYRVLPDRFVNLADQLREASLAVFLLGERYDRSVKELADAAARQDKPWVAWCSPSAARTEVPEQMVLLEYVEKLVSPKKTYLDASVSVCKLKEEVRSLLNPDPRAMPDLGGKRRVYLIYKSGDRAEKMNAGRIAIEFDPEFHFDHPDDPAKHTARLTGSDGVLLLWGSAEEKWASGEFAAIVNSARNVRARGLCVFDPKEAKSAILEEIREKARDVHIAEEFGNFDPGRLHGFFNSLRRPAQTDRA
jgi:hypothetical protein